MKTMIIAMVLASVSSAAAAAAAEPEVFNHRPAQRQAEDMLESGRLGELADKAFDGMFKLAESELHKRGHDAEAMQLHAEWNYVYKGMLTTRGPFGDTGDRSPLIQWIADWYTKIEAILGPEIMDFTHLSDINQLNRDIKVVFDPHGDAIWCAEQLAAHPDDACVDEYSRNFAGTKYQRGDDPFATDRPHFGFGPIVVYWSVWIACEVVTYGSGAFLICSPAATLAEIGTARWVAPPLSDRIWESRN